MKAEVQQPSSRLPTVRVVASDWDRVVAGLLDLGLCRLLPREQAFCPCQQPILSGLFGVSKDEWVAEVEVMRLIMNLVPVNEWFHPIEGDLQTLPVISQLHALDLDPSENLLLSSEDLKCYFYTLRVPDAWSKYFAFSKVVPQCFNPSGDSRPHVLASRVLPMGFASSVAVAQHVHRNVVRRSMHDPRSQLCPEGELRRDKFWSSHNPGWRVYLDNYDELSRHSTGSEPVGQRPASMKALRATYSESGMPVNEKKSCLAQLEGEMQGAPVNGDTGYALAKEDKFCKYLHMAVVVLESPCASLKEMQILTGGMVYLASFRRVAMSCLNEIWRFLQKLAQDMKRLLIPPAVRREIALFIGVAPLLQIRFRNCISPIVTASDASETGGGVVASVSVTGYGLEASQRKVRGETPEWWDGAQILGIGVGDNIGSFRVALDVLQVPLAGYVSVEPSKPAQRVLMSQFPNVLCVCQASDVTLAVVKAWACRFSRACMVLLHVGPGCVDGLPALPFVLQLRSWLSTFFHGLEFMFYSKQWLL